LHSSCCRSRRASQQTRRHSLRSSECTFTLLACQAPSAMFKQR
jgi:hypothetical protein